MRSQFLRKAMWEIIPNTVLKLSIRHRTDQLPHKQQSANTGCMQLSAHPTAPPSVQTAQLVASSYSSSGLTVIAEGFYHSYGLTRIKKEWFEAETGEV